jgi:hypothetical protein
MTGGVGNRAPHVGDGGVILGVDKVVGSGLGRWSTAVRRDGSFDRRCGPGVEWSGGLAAFGYTVFTAPMVVALAARPHVQNVFPSLPRLYLPADNHILPSLGNLGLFGLAGCPRVAAVIFLTITFLNCIYLHYK